MIISFVNQKGGVGKTTLSLCVAFELGNKAKVLTIDADPQGSIMDWSENREQELPKNMSIASMANKAIHRDIKRLAKGYTYVVIDTPPRLSEITRSAIMISDIVIIPCTPSPYDVWAAEETLELIREAKIYNKKLKMVFILNKKILNTIIGRDVKNAIESLGSDFTVCQTEIHQRVIFAEAAAQGKLVQEIDKEKKASAEIKKFVIQLIK